MPRFLLLFAWMILSPYWQAATIRLRIANWFRRLFGKPEKRE